MQYAISSVLSLRFIVLYLNYLIVDATRLLGGVGRAACASGAIVDNIDVAFITTTPVITENRFIHSKAFYEKTRLQVRWKEVENATSYEILVTKQDGTEHTYTSTGTSLTVNKGSDDFMTECVMGGTVKVRAVKGDGEAYSMWTEEDTISCNVLFH